MSAYGEGLEPSPRRIGLLREGLLSGRRIALSGSARGGVGAELERLGAKLVAPSEQPDVLIHDAAGAFEADGLVPALQRTWSAIAQAVNDSLIPRARRGAEGGVQGGVRGGTEAGARGGKIVLIAPRSGAGERAEAARAALENLARTLSTEWARYGITTTAIAPGDDTTDEQVAALVCFLVSRAGDYFSGCRFDLGSAFAP